MGIESRAVKIEIKDDMMTLIVGNETHKMPASELYDAMEGKQDNVKYLIHNMGVSLALDDVKIDSPEAIKASIELKTFKL